MRSLTVLAVSLCALLLQGCGPSKNKYIRVNQVGFTTVDTKLAYLMATSATSDPVELVDASTETVAHMITPQPSKGKWNMRYSKIYVLDFTSFAKVGTFYLRGLDVNRTPAFTIRDTRMELFAPLLENSVFFYQVQRDGPDVNSSVYDRRPSHLADESATVYEPAEYNDYTLKPLDKVHGARQRDCSGGWMDAGDYIKFVETISYTVALMLSSLRDYPASSAILKDEARFGLDWLVKMWDRDTKTLYYQVGIGDGNSNVRGDHDTLRLPEDDDELDVEEGDDQFYIKYRPLFRAAKGGSPISPNLAGRMAAVFALGAQVWAGDDDRFASELSSSAEQIYKLADTSHENCEVDEEVLLTASPFGYYGETEWCSDMQLGAVALHSLTRKSSYLEDAKKFAQMYMNDYDAVQRFNLYDVAVLAHTHLIRELPESDSYRERLLVNFKAGLDNDRSKADDDIFGLGMKYGSDVDAVPEILGLALSALLYDDVAGSDRFSDFANRQLDWVLGANGWGVSFVVGAASDMQAGIFPKCLQHNIEMLKGAPKGYDRILLGAVVDGPSSHSQKPDSGDECIDWTHGMDPYKEFTRGKWSFRDNQANWAGTEPADDYTAMSVMLWARLMNGREQAFTHGLSKQFALV